MLNVPSNTVSPRHPKSTNRTSARDKQKAGDLWDENIISFRSMKMRRMPSASLKTLNMLMSMTSSSNISATLKVSARLHIYSVFTTKPYLWIDSKRLKLEGQIDEMLALKNAG